MIQNNLKTLIDDHLKQLPEYHQEVLGTFDWIGILEEIGAKYRLSAKQIELLVRESAMVILQISEPELFKVNLINHVGVSDVTAHSVILDISNRILTRLQTELTRTMKDAPDLMLAELTKQGVSSVVGSQILSAVTSEQQQEPESAGIVTNQLRTEKSNSSSDPYREEIE